MGCGEDGESGGMWVGGAQHPRANRKCTRASLFQFCLTTLYCRFAQFTPSLLVRHACLVSMISSSRWCNFLSEK